MHLKYFEWVKYYDRIGKVSFQSNKIILDENEILFDEMIEIKILFGGVSSQGAGSMFLIANGISHIKIEKDSVVVADFKIVLKQDKQFFTLSKIVKSWHNKGFKVEESYKYFYRELKYLS